MKKEELYTQIMKKGIEKQELDSKLKEFENWYIEKGIESEKAKLNALARLQTYYKKMKGQLFKGFIYGIDKITDFGAKNLYDKAIKKYKESPEEAIAQGFVDENGKPIYSGDRAPKDGKIRYIDLEKDRAMPIYLIIETKEGMKMVSGFLKPELFDISKPMKKKIKFIANIDDKNEDDVKLYFNSDLSFDIIEEEELDIQKFLEENMKENFCEDLTKIKDYHKEEQKNRIIAIKGNVNSINFTNEGVSNIIKIDSPMFDMDTLPITCWIPEITDIDFDENALDVIVIGKSNLVKDNNTDEENIQLNAISLWCPKEYRVERNQEIINEEEIKEEKVKIKKSFDGINTEKNEKSKDEKEQLEEEEEEVF